MLTAKFCNSRARAKKSVSCGRAVKLKHIRHTTTISFTKYNEHLRVHVLHYTHLSYFRVIYEMDFAK